MNPPWLVSLFDGLPLTRQQTAELFVQIVEGKVEPVVLAAILIAMKLRGESTCEIAGAVDAISAAALPFRRPAYPLLDIVGTGGDGFNTINISTSSCVVAASLGARVIKQGNKSVSGKSGSSDLMASFGVNLHMPAWQARRCLDSIGFSYLFAPHYHQGFRNASDTRKALSTRTIFNLVGPLVNPARPDYLLLGVYKPELVKPMAEALAALNVKRAMVVHGSGLDEIALHGPTNVAELQDGKVQTFEISATDFGLTPAPLQAIVGGESAENAAIARALFTGGGTEAQRNIIAANTGAALYLSGICPDLRAGASAALQAMDSGRPMRLLERLAKASHAAELETEIHHG